MGRARIWKRAAAGIVVMGGLSTTAWAQLAVPGLGGAAGLGPLGAAPVAAAPLAATPVVAAPRTIWSFFGLDKASLRQCRDHLCQTQIGQMFNAGATPLSAMTGGLLPAPCPAVPTDQQISDLANKGGPLGPEAVAAKIKQDEADAKARRAAVRYLSTADCHYWPEAEAALITALRDDRNECVRYEAALAFLNGCCCTKKTIEALTIVVTGSDKDGKPSETSDRVRGVAIAALQGCLLRSEETPQPQPTPPERPEPAVASRTQPRPLPPSLERVAYYFRNLEGVPMSLVMENARRAVAREKSAGKVASVPLTGERSVFDALVRATATPDRPKDAAPAAPAPRTIALQVVPDRPPIPQPNPARTPRPAERSTPAPEDRKEAADPSVRRTTLPPPPVSPPGSSTPSPDRAHSLADVLRRSFRGN